MHPRICSCSHLISQVTLLKTLILWSLSASDAVQATLKESYKQSRHEDDKNQPLSVQPWGRDGYKRNYWLIEGQDDTHFRVYRENNGATAKTNTWFSVAGSIEEITKLADKLDEENTPHARTLRDRIRAATTRFEAGEEVRHLLHAFTGNSDLVFRNGDDETIASLAKLLLPGQNQGFRFTKVERVARGCGTPIPRMMTTDRTLCLLEDLPVHPAYRHRLSILDLP